MAVKDTEALLLQLAVDMRQSQRELTKLRDMTDRRLNEMEKSALKSTAALANIMERGGRDVTEAFRRGLGGIAGVLASTFSAQQVIAYADSYTGLQNRLRAAGLEGERMKAVEDALYDSANRNGLQVNATAELYQRASLSRQRLGASEDELLQLVSGTAAALKVQGTSAEAASGPLLQLGQVLSGTKVQAEEYNSLIDGLPVVLQAAAKGSERFGGDVAKLTGLVKDGKVTSQEFFRALLNGFPAIEKQADSAVVTVAGSLQTLNNQLGRYVGQTDQGLSATQRMAQVITLLANNLDVVVQAGMVAVAIVGTRWVVATTAATASNLRYQFSLLSMAAAQQGVTRSSILATTAVAGLNSALSFFGGPIGVAILAVAAAISYGAVETAKYEQAVNKAENAVRGYRIEQENAAKAAKEAGKEKSEFVSSIPSDIANLAALTGQVDKLGEAWFQVAAQARIAAIEQAKTRANDARNNAKVLKEAAAKSEGSDRITGAPLSLGGVAPAAAMGQFNSSKYVSQRTKQLRDAANVAQQAADTAEAEVARLQTEKVTPVSSPKTYAPTGGTNKADDAKAAAAEAKRIELAQEDLRLEEAIAKAKAGADAKAIKTAEDAQRLVQLRRQYEAAGYADAEKRAETHLGYERQALALIESREKTEKWIADIIDASQRAGEEYRQKQAQAAALVADELNLRIRIAQLSGDDKALKLAERELYIHQRIAELKDLKPNATEAQNTAQATREADQMETARKYGEARQMFGQAFSEGIRAAATGDLAGFLENMVGSAAERALQKAGEQLYDLVFGAGQELAMATTTGTAQGAAQGAAAATAIVTASATGAATMSAAIISAGQIAGTAMAAQIATASAASGGGDAVSKLLSSLTSFEGGGYTGSGVRAGGLDGKGGRLTMIHPKEIVHDLTKPPPPASAFRRAQIPTVQNFNINAAGAIMASDIVEDIQRTGAKAALTGAQGGAQLAQTNQMQRTRRQLGKR
ncbi:tape measure protein [Asticcacaulis excentricus]|uniref:Phage tape measure protein n=1 Tax=Asticcacaulis excentricus (strain ATCC 15261 / DSM 4724 / KCTC 12464 / NCIMB 9791 / VKM B-1370 / CB 48) TaxID=573065 RepID=E8RPR2_ASTEC|nr:tape measure protein [Asticcacaulis excentricus]ADU12039.1 phage tape measure protein [Asticcacaulis excentricus CB 48]